MTALGIGLLPTALSRPSQGHRIRARCKSPDDDPATLANAALVLVDFREDIVAMTVPVDRALALNPNYARTVDQRADALVRQ
jgi:hypothetical protein